MSVPESIAWLETSRDSHSPSLAQLYATTILGELHRLHDSLEICAREVEKLERLREEAVTAHRAVEATLGSLEDKAKQAREDWDGARTLLEAQLTDLRKKLGFAEGILKDIHFGLLKQPELTREDLAKAIESAVTPHPEGAKAVGDPYLWESGT
jgi:chromosome segregation ATPase